MDTIKNIIDYLATYSNFDKLIELSKIHKEINLYNHLYLCPDININGYTFDLQHGGFKTLNIGDIETFQLIDKTTHKDKTFFLKNLDKIKYIKTYNKIYYVTNGEYYIGADNFRSIEFDLHNLNNYAKDNTYSVFGNIVSEEDFIKISRHNKLSSILKTTISTKEFVKIMKLKKQKLFNEKREKKLLKTADKTNYSKYIDNDQNNIYSRFA